MTDHSVRRILHDALCCFVPFSLFKLPFMNNPAADEIHNNARRYNFNIHEL